MKQAKLREGAARVALTAAQRRLRVNLAEYNPESSSANQQLASLSASVVTARESLRLPFCAMSTARARALEVVDAEGALTSSENAEINGRTRYHLALASLQTLTGRL